MEDTAEAARYAASIRQQQEVVMKPALLLRPLIILAASTCAAAAADPVQTDGDKYKVRFENDRVRVLEYRDMPGDKTNQHHHPAFVLFALSPFTRTITLPDGKVLTREFKTGEILKSEAQTHIGANVGSTPTHVIMIEMK